jgi:L-lactate utilization protein LutB
MRMRCDASLTAITSTSYANVFVGPRNGADHVVGPEDLYLVAVGSGPMVEPKNAIAASL